MGGQNYDHVCVEDKQLVSRPLLSSLLTGLIIFLDISDKQSGDKT